MNAPVAVLVVLVASAGGDHRLVADAEVTWWFDGKVIARTDPLEPATVTLPPGNHEIWAASDAEGPWSIMVRADPGPGHGVQPVVAATASHAGSSEASGLLPWVVGGAGAAVMAARPLRSALEALRVSSARGD